MFSACQPGAYLLVVGEAQLRHEFRDVRRGRLLREALERSDLRGAGFSCVQGKLSPRLSNVGTDPYQ